MQTRVRGIILITCHTGVTDRIILSCVRPPIRRGEFELDLCSFGVGRTTKPIDHSLDMRSFRIVERVTKVGVHLGWYWAVPLTPFRIVERVTNSREHQFEIHINIREKPSTGVVRGVDVGGKHLAVTADTNGHNDDSQHETSFHIAGD